MQTASAARTGAKALAVEGRSREYSVEANLQHFLEREGIAFINERRKVTVGALMASRGGKMKSHKRGKSVDLGRSDIGLTVASWARDSLRRAMYLVNVAVESSGMDMHCLKQLTIS